MYDQVRTETDRQLGTFNGFEAAASITLTSPQVDPHSQVRGFRTPGRYYFVFAFDSDVAPGHDFPLGLHVELVGSAESRATASTSAARASVTTEHRTASAPKTAGGRGFPVALAAMAAFAAGVLLGGGARSIKRRTS
jgi:hypothetical protein